MSFFSMSQLRLSFSFLEHYLKCSRRAYDKLWNGSVNRLVTMDVHLSSSCLFPSRSRRDTL